MWPGRLRFTRCTNRGRFRMRHREYGRTERHRPTTALIVKAAQSANRKMPKPRRTAFVPARRLARGPATRKTGPESRTGRLHTTGVCPDRNLGGASAFWRAAKIWTGAERLEWPRGRNRRALRSGRDPWRRSSLTCWPRTARYVNIGPASFWCVAENIVLKQRMIFVAMTALGAGFLAASYLSDFDYAAIGVAFLIVGLAGLVMWPSRTIGDEIREAGREICAELGEDRREIRADLRGAPESAEPDGAPEHAAEPSRTTAPPDGAPDSPNGTAKPPERELD